MKNTVVTFAQAKQEGRKISMLTAYDYCMAKLIDEAGVDSILVGDSLGMPLLWQICPLCRIRHPFMMQCVMQAD